MTISSESRKAGPFTGNGVTTSFPFTFKVFEDSDLRVVRTTPTGAETDLVLDSDYSVTLNPDQNATPGGTITYPLSGDPLSAGWTLTAVGNIQALQETDLTNQGGFYPQVIEDALDRATILIQQAEEQAGRTLRLPVSDDGEGIELPSAPSRAGKVLGFDASGVPQMVEVVEGSEVAIVNRQKFTATAAQTDFTTSFSFTPGVNAVSVFLNGSKLVITDDYLELTDTTIRLNAGAAVNDTVEVISTGLAAGVADQVEQNAIAAGISEANAAASEAAAALSAASAAASANAAAGTYYVATKSAGDTLASSLPDAATVIVEADESATPAGVKVRYTVTGGALTSAVIEDSAKVRFTPAGTGAVSRTAQDKLREVVSVKDFGAVGDGVTDDTAAFTAAFVASRKVYAPAPVVSYRVSAVTIPANSELITDGLATKLHQVAGTAVGTRIITVGGSNVRIGTLTVKGNIATDTNEQNHGIFMQANATYGSINNITIGDIYGEDIRGDVIYFGQATGGIYKLTNVHIGNITFDNVYRNGVSCVSADGFSVASVTGSRCGFTHMDVEANVGSGPCVNGVIGYIKGRCFGLVSPTAADYIDNIDIGVLDLATSHAAQSSPSYAPGVAVEDGFLLRNVKRVKVGHLKAEGFNRCAIFVTYLGGELGCEYLGIDSVYLRNNAITDAVYLTHIQFPTITSNHLEIGRIDAQVSGVSKRIITGLRSGFIRSAIVDVQSSASFMRDCQNVQAGTIIQTGAGGFMWQTNVNCSVAGGSFTGDRLATSTTKCRFENFTATAAVFLFTSGQENHVIVNSTLNGSYYGYGVGIRAHTMPLRFGAFNLWVDATGDLRIKGGDPTSDTDGTVVGTQT